MAISEKQNELDLNKWYRSEEAGHDMCGEFDFCVKCNKNIENPCATAFALFEQEQINKPKSIKEKPIAAKAAKKKIASELTSKPTKKKSCKTSLKKSK